MRKPWVMAMLTMATTMAGAQLVELEYTELGTMGPRTPALGPIVSDDGRHAAWVEQRDGRFVGVLDGAVVGTSYAAVEWATLAISPDGTRIGFVAVKGDRQIAVIDGRESRPYRKIRGIHFSPDSRHVAFIGEEADCQYLLFDWQESQPLEWVASYNLGEYEPLRSVLYLADGHGYVHLTGGRHLGGYRRRLWINGEPGPEYDWAGFPPFDPPPTTGHIVYPVVRDGVWHLMVNGEEGPGYDELDSLALSADRQHYAYVAKRGERQFVVHDGVGGPEYETIPGGPVLSPDGTRVAYTVRREGSEAVVVDGEEGLWCDYAEKVIFSPDSQRVAHEGWFGNESFVVLDGEPQPDYDYVSELTFSPDSRRFAYRAYADQRARVVVDGEQGPTFQPFGDIAFSPDSRRFVYQASPRPGDWRVIVDHIWEGPMHVFFVSPPRFTAERTIEYLAVVDSRTSRLCRVKLGVEYPGEGDE